MSDGIVLNEAEKSTALRMTKVFKLIAGIIATAGALYQIYIAGAGATSAISLRALHWTYISALVFLYYPANSKKPESPISVVDIILVLAAITAGLYIQFSWQAVAERMGFTIPRDLVFGVIQIAIVLEATRRVVGIPLTVLAAVFIVYVFAGPHLPSVIAHKGYSLNALIRTLYISTDGIYGMPIGISATYVVLFVLFGSILKVSGGGQFFTDVAFGLVGKSSGGPAKAAVVSSSLMGMMSGAAVANVVTTGTFTIPLMKRSGYPPYMAGAIEAVASTGGQFVPPIMGAAAFMIADIVGVPFGRVAVAAIIPALLYYFYLYMCVDIEARKRGIVGIKKEDLPSVKTAFRERGHLLLPLASLFYLILSGYSASKSIFFCIIGLLVVSSLRKGTRISPKMLFDAIVEGIRNAIPVATACAAAGIITGVISVTGIGLRFSSILIQLSGNSVLLMLVLSMVASVILGMGLPTSVAYIILAILTAPALISLGVEPLAAHFFIFFFGCVSTITPPVALSAYAGAGIAGANPMRTGYTAFRLGLVGFLVPYIAVFRTEALMMGSFISIVVFMLFMVFAFLAITYGVEGYSGRRLRLWERILFLAMGIALLLNINVVVNIIVVIGVAAAAYLTSNKKNKVQAAV